MKACSTQAVLYCANSLSRLRLHVARFIFALHKKEYHIVWIYSRMVRVKKNAIICQMCAPFFDKISRHNFMVCAGSGEIRQMRRIFTAKGAAILQKVPHYKTAHCGTAIKVRRFWWEKSGTHAAMFSSAAVAFF